MKAAPVLAWAFALAAALSWPVAAQAPHAHRHGFQGADHWARVFDDPQRDVWQKPHEVIQSLALKADAVVADIGAGTGYFATRLARMLPKGKIYAVDTEPDMVKYLSERARREALPNLAAVQASAADARLPELADLILFVDVYHHVDDRERYLRRLRNSLKPAGRVAIIDFRMDSPIGPPPSGRLAPGQVRSEFERAGYTLIGEHDFLPNQYFLIFRPATPRASACGYDAAGVHVSRGDAFVMKHADAACSRSQPVGFLGRLMSLAAVAPLT